MKTINYTGSSKLISRIVNLLNRKAPLPLDCDGDPDWGSNGQVLSTDGSGNTAWVNQGGGGSGGHTIEDSSGTAMTQRAGLQFVGATVTDDSVDDRTVVTIPTPTTYSAGTGIDINNNNISAKLKQSTLSVESSVTRTAVSNREYMVEMDSDGYLAVNVPWVAQQQSDWNETNTSSKSYIQNKPTLGGAASQEVANNVTTTAAGSVLDARQGKTLNDARKALIIGKKVYVTASIGPGVDYPISCTIPTGYLPLSVTGSSYMNDQGILGSPYYATSGTTKCRWKNLNTVTVTLNSQMCVFYFVKNEITVS